LDKKNITSDRSWAETLSDFEDHLLQKGRSDETISAYVSTMKAFGTFYTDYLKKARLQIARLQETDIYTFVDYLKSTRRVALSSLNRSISALHAFSRFLIEKGCHKRDIATGLKSYRLGLAPEPPRLSTEEVRRLVASVDLNGRNGQRNHAILQMFLQSGLRLGELTRLSRRDVVIHQTTGRVTVRDEKGRSGRVVPLNQSARSALKGYLRIRGETDGDVPLFVAERGKGISAKTVQYLIKKHLCAIGRSDLSVHDLRHHFAMELYNRTGKLPAVQAVLGHKSVITTARYARSTEKEISEAMDGLPDNIYHCDHPEGKR